MRWRRFGLVLVVVPVLATGCGSSSSSSTRSSSGTSSTAAATSPEWTGFGAKATDWQTAHPEGTEGCAPQHCYGTKVSTGANESMYEFTSVSVSDAEHRIDGYTQALGEGQIEASAKAAVLGLLPRDTHTTEFYIEHQNGSCASWNVRSATLARWFAKDPKIGDPQGVVGIVLYTPNANGESEYKPGKIAFANVNVAPQRHGISC
jgi:hypothetical protein